MKKLFAIMLVTNVCMMEAMEDEKLFTPVDITYKDLEQFDIVIDQLTEEIADAERLSNLVKNNIAVFENSATRSALQQFFDYWVYKLLVIQESIGVVNVGLSQFIDKFRGTPSEEKQDAQLLNNGVFITALLNNFLNNLAFTHASFQLLQNRINAVNIQSKREERIPWQSCLWSKLLSRHKDSAAQISCGLNTLAKLTDELGKHATQRVELRECPF